MVERAKKSGFLGYSTIDRKMPPRKLSIVKSILRLIWAPKMKNHTHFSFFFQKIPGFEKNSENFMLHYNEHRLEKCKKKRAVDPKIRFAPPLYCRHSLHDLISLSNRKWKEERIELN